MAWAVAVRIPRHTDADVVSYDLHRDGVFVANIPQPATGDPTYTYAIAADGDYTLQSKAVDSVGNKSPLSPALNVHLDHIAPSAPGLMVMLSASWAA